MPPKKLITPGGKIYLKGKLVGHKQATRLAPTTQKAVKKIVKKVIKSQEETKLQVYQAPAITFNGAISSTNEWYNPIPAVQIGSASYTREGNQIKPTLLDMNWHISLGTGVNRSCDDTVVLYLFKMKNARSFADMIARGSAGTFLDLGSTGLSQFTGVLPDLHAPVNNDGYTVVKKYVFKLNKGPGPLNGDTNNYSGAGGITSRRINVKLRSLPTFMYQTGNSDGLPENYGLCWALGYAKSDGSSPDVINQDVRVDFSSTLYYKDS